jgi:DNA-directed RNA polymerase III subunit RPC5
LLKLTLVCDVGKLHLHPISETHQLRPTLTYMDILTRKIKRRSGADSDEDSDDGPPPDPDEPTTIHAPKKEKKTTSEAKEVQVAVRKSDDKSMQLGGGLTAVRRELLMAIRAEEDERWEDLQYFENGVRASFW